MKLWKIIEWKITYNNKTLRKKTIKERLLNKNIIFINTNLKYFYAINMEEKKVIKKYIILIIKSKNKHTKIILVD